MNKEVMFYYYHVLLSSSVSAFRKPMHRLWCQRNPSLADVSEQCLADQKRFLLASGKLTESELEEIKREAAQDGKPRSGLSSAMIADHSSVQTSAMDELLVDDSAAMTLVGDSVTPRMTAAEMAPGARGRKPVVSMMQEDHDSADYSGSGLVVQTVVVLSGDRSFTRDNGDILSVNDTSDVVWCSAVNGSPPCNSVERVEYLGSGSIVRPVSVLFGDCSSTRDSGDILSVDDTSDVVQCSDGNGSLPPCNFVRSVEHLRSGSVVQPVAVLSGDCSSTRDSGDILSLDDTSDAVQCSAGDGSPPSRDSAGFDLMRIRPSTASQLEQTETLRTQLSSVSSCQTEDGHSLFGAAAVDPVLRREFLDELQKVRQIPICERPRLPRIFVSSKIQKRIDDVNAIIDSSKDEPDMSEISYLVYTAASVVYKRHGSKTAKSANSHTPTWRRRLDMEITTLRRAISLLQEARKGSSSIRLLHELRLLRRRLSIAPSEARDVTINRLKMELQPKREKARRLEKNRKRLRRNGLFRRDARRFYGELGKQTIQITSPPSESEIEQYWGDILETEICHNKSAFWLRHQIDDEMSQTAEQ